MKLMNTPMRVYKEAERRGDTAVMERAMGYAGDFADKAEDYRKTIPFCFGIGINASGCSLSQLLALAYVWFSGLRESLAKTAYRDIWINFTSLFVLLCIINTVIYVFKKKRGQKGEKNDRSC